MGLIVAKYDRKIFANEDNGFCILVYKSSDQTVPVQARQKENDSEFEFIAKGNNLPTGAGVEVELDGEWTSSNYGIQLNVTAFKEILPNTVDGIEQYLASGQIKGIGPKTAKQIVKAYGAGALDILDNEPNKLLEISGITEGKLAVIKDSYQAKRDVRDIIVFLSPFGITPNKAIQIYKAFGNESMQILQQEPFRLCDISGFGFTTVDAIARAVKCSPDDPMRITGALEYILKGAAGNKGHLFLPKDELMNEADTLLNEKFIEEVVSISQIKGVLYSDLVKNKMVIDGDNVYLQKAYYSELNTADKIARMLVLKCPEYEIDNELKRSQSQLGITLSRKQIDGIKMCLSSNISILTGGPGTGKTTILKVILDIYRKMNEYKTVLLAAPTGRAARRMTESTDEKDASTLHSALGIYNEEYGEDFIISDDFIIIDESSMMDMWLANELYKKLRIGAKVLLVGDADQLLSVGPGNVFRELINCGKIPVTFLDVIFRQADTSNIIINAHKINNGKTDLEVGEDFMLIPSEKDSETAALMIDIYLKEVEEKGIDNVQILTPFRKEKVKSGSDNLNKTLHELLNPADGSLEIKASGRIFRKGDKVMQTKNTIIDENGRAVHVSNGDIGYIKGIEKEKDHLYASILFNDSWVRFDAEQLSSVEHAYATTIHKSQGSEYNTVIIPVISLFTVMLKRNLIYTAITRAKTKVIIVGSKDVLKKAIRRSDIDKRNTLLGQRINDIYGLISGEQCAI